MYLVRNILNIFNLHSTTPSKIKCIFSLKKQKRQNVIRNYYLHMSFRFRRIRVPLKVKVASSSRTPASHRPGVCVHMHTQVCTQTCMYHSKISEKEKKEEEKEREDDANLLCQAPRPTSAGAFGSGRAVLAAFKPSGYTRTAPQAPSAACPQPRESWRWQSLRDCGGDRGHRHRRRHSVAASKGLCGGWEVRQ